MSADGSTCNAFGMLQGLTHVKGHVVAGICQHVLGLSQVGLVAVSSFPHLSQAMLGLHLLGCQLLLQLQPLHLASLQLPCELRGQ